MELEIGPTAMIDPYDLLISLCSREAAIRVLRKVEPWHPKLPEVQDWMSRIRGR